MNRKRVRRVGVPVLLGGLAVVILGAAPSCPQVADPITSASVVSFTGSCAGLSQMTWSWTYAGFTNSVAPTSVDVTILRDGTSIMYGGGAPVTVSGTETERSFGTWTLCPHTGTFTIRFECTYPTNTIPATATYEFSEEL